MQNIVEVWINAFIPKTVKGYTETVGKGVHVNKTAVPLPWQARLWPGNTLKPRHQGYLSDQRDFSSLKAASTRMQSSATIKVTPTGLVATANSAATSGTIGIDIETGVETGRAGANLSKCTCKPVPGRPGAKDIYTGVALAPTVQSVVVEIVGVGSDPLVALSAAIDYEGQFQVVRDPAKPGLTVQFVGKIDAFPAFEAYASFNGRTQTLFTAAPPPNNTVMNLPGKANRPVRGRAIFT